MNEKKTSIPVSKFTLTTGKEIYLREPEIGDTEHAMKIAGMEASDNQAYLSIIFQREMIKLLLVKVDSKVLELKDKQLIKDLFNFREWNQVQKAVMALIGDEGNVILTPEITSI